MENIGFEIYTSQGVRYLERYILPLQKNAKFYGTPISPGKFGRPEVSDS